MERATESSPARRATSPDGDTMRQLVLRRGSHDPALREAPRPRRAEGEALVRSLLVGVDGTDEEVVAGGAEFPEGDEFLVLGHECLGEVLEAPDGCGLAPGDRVVPLVRHGCGECRPCLSGHADFCETGRYTEHGIKGRHGFLREAWTDDPATLVRVPDALGDEAVLAEPLSVGIKALEVAEAAQRRVPGFEGFRGQRALLAGTGSLGSLAAFLLAERGVESWALDRSPDDAAPARLVSSLGLRHVNSKETDIAALAREVGGFDLIVEATGSPKLTFELAQLLNENGVMVLLGVPAEADPLPVEADDVMRRLVLGNQALVGSVNSGRRHFEQALEALGRFGQRWPDVLDGVITHRLSAGEAAEAIALSSADLVKKVVDWRSTP